MKSAKSASEDFRNAPLPNPRRRVLRVWQARFQPPARKKSAMDRDCCSPRQAYPPANQFAAIKRTKSASADFKNHPSPTREGGICVFGRRGFNRRRAKNQRGIWIVAPRQAYPPANQFAAIKCAKSASADFRNAPVPNPRRRVLHVWQARFQPPARKNHRWIWIAARRQYQHIPLRINSRL